MTDKDRAPQWGDESAGVTKQEWLATAISVFVIGILVGWALFGQPNEDCALAVTGSMAEWIAAIGTWVVGYMAWRIGTTSHEQKLREYEDKLREEARSRRYRRGNTTTRVMQLGGLIDLFDAVFQNQFTAILSPERADPFAENALRVLDSVRWTTEEFADFEPEEQKQLHRISSLCSTLRFHIERFRSMSASRSLATPGLLPTIRPYIRKLDTALGDLLKLASEPRKKAD